MNLFRNQILESNKRAKNYEKKMSINKTILILRENTPYLAKFVWITNY